MLNNSLICYFFFSFCIPLPANDSMCEVEIKVFSSFCCVGVGRYNQHTVISPPPFFSFFLSPPLGMRENGEALRGERKEEKGQEKFCLLAGRRCRHRWIHIK